MENREAIEMLERFQNPEPWEPKITDRAYEALQIAISALENQDADRWIPCSERLPEDYSDVLVWFEYFRYGSYNHLYQTYGIGNYSARYDAWTINHESGWSKLRVIAWMPLPEPYTEEEA